MRQPKKYTINGIERTIRQLSEDTGLSISAIHQRLRRGFGGSWPDQAYLLKRARAGEFDYVGKSPTDDSTPACSNPWAVAAAKLHDRLATQSRAGKIREREERQAAKSDYKRRHGHD